MIPPPKGTVLTAEERDELRTWEEFIDENIRKRYRPGQALYINVQISARVRIELRRKYENGGWMWTDGADRDGIYMKLEAKR